MDELNLAAIQQRWEATTPGEWITTAQYEGSAYETRIICLQGDYPDPDARMITLIDLCDAYTYATTPDLIFIAEAHQDVPRLIEEIARLRAELAAVPVEAIRRYWQKYNLTFGFLGELRQHEADRAEVGAWLSSLEAQP